MPHEWPSTPTETGTQPEAERAAGFRARAMLLACIVVFVCVVGELLASLAGLPARVAMIVGTTAGVLGGLLGAGPLVAAPALASDARRRAMIDRIARVARTDRASTFDELLEVEDDPALGPLARALHEALTGAHRDRLEAAALRREMAHKVEKESRKRTATLTHEAERDELTGLLNRRGFERALRMMIERAHRAGTEVTLLAIDMDRFKQLNDTCGHDAGDEALRMAGELIGAHTRDTDISARVGGDEFFIAFDHVDTEAAITIGERLIDLFSNHPVGRSMEVWPGMSIGVARLRADGAKDANDLRRIADEALYRSKREGRGRVSRPRAA
ncbi:MAG: hypothetical protein Tsb0013_25050 [Phycisphaerales bacterium]